MATSIESGRSPSPNKENTSDIIPSLGGDDPEQNKVANAKVLERATLKIDFYLIPIVAMFCVSFLPLVSPSTAKCSSLVQISCHSW